MLIKTIIFSQSIKYFATVFNLNGHNYRKNLDLALSYEVAGDKTKAIKYYQKCISLNPNRDLYKSIGMLYYGMQDYVSAINYLEKTYRDLEASLFLGLSYLNLNAPIKAEQILESMGNKKSTHSRMLADNIYEFKNGHERCGRKSVIGENILDSNNSGLKQLYNVLELTDVSSKKEIKKAYIKMAKKWHPDRYYNDPRLLTRAEQKMKVINEAYYKLCNS